MSGKAATTIEVLDTVMIALASLDERLELLSDVVDSALARTPGAPLLLEV